MRFCAFAYDSEALTMILAENDNPVCETTLFHQVDDYLTLLQHLLDIADWTSADLDFIGIVYNSTDEQIPTQVEPAAKVAQQLQLPIVSVLAVDVLAWLAQEHDQELVVIDAAQEPFWYTASYTWDQSLQRPICLDAPHRTKPQELLKQLSKRKKPFFLAGKGLSCSKKHIKTQLGVDALFLPITHPHVMSHCIVQAIWHQWQMLGPEKTPFSLYSFQHGNKNESLTGYANEYSARSFQKTEKPYAFISPMCEEDLKQIMKIELRSFASPWSPLAFVSELRYNTDAYYYSLFHQNQIIGYIGLWLIFDKGYIIKVAIAPEWRRQGWGRYLIKHVFSEPPLLNIKEICLELRKSNQAAFCFYQSLGFRQTGTLSNYYENPVEDAVIMCLNKNEQGLSPR